MRSARFVVNDTGLEFDRDYGMNHRTGWTAILDGRAVVQFVSFWKAAWRLYLAALREGEQ